MNDTYQIEYSVEALEDLRGIFAYIAYELLVPENARGQVERIQKTIRSLDFMPERYALVDWEPWKSRRKRHIKYSVILIRRSGHSCPLLLPVIHIFLCGHLTVV